MQRVERVELMRPAPMMTGVQFVVMAVNFFAVILVPEFSTWLVMCLVLPALQSMFSICVTFQGDCC